MVADSEDYIKGFTKNLKDLQSLENHLNFQPVLEPKQKLEQLRELDMTHMR